MKALKKNCLDSKGGESPNEYIKRVSKCEKTFGGEVKILNYLIEQVSKCEEEFSNWRQGEQYDGDRYDVSSLYNKLPKVQEKFKSPSNPILKNLRGEAESKPKIDLKDLKENFKAEVESKLEAYNCEYESMNRYIHIGNFNKYYECIGIIENVVLESIEAMA